jgi:Sec-independent protein translocase protein TatA
MSKTATAPAAAPAAPAAPATPATTSTAPASAAAVAPPEGSKEGSTGASASSAPAAPKADAAGAPSLLDAAKDSPAAASKEEPASLLDEAYGDEPKAEEGKQAEKQEGKDKSETGAPEDYVDFKLPEGMTTNAEALTEFKTVAKELNLSQEQAQKLVDLQAKTVQSIGDATQRAWKSTVDTWTKDTIQTLGANYQQELRFVAKAIDRFGSPELRQVLNETGIGNHKEIVSLLMKVGKTVSEDSFANGKAGASASKSAAQTLYPNHPSKT